MPTGKFRFDTLLKIRENLRDEKKGELLALQKTLDILEKERQEWSEKIAAHLLEWKTAQKENHVSVDILIQHQNYHRYLTDQLVALNKKIEQTAYDVEQKHTELNDAVRDVKILEKLREKKQIQQTESEQRKVEKQMDEFVSQEKTFQKIRQESGT